ncbi:MAG: ABC transporter permease [Geminicoccaceae bacterium]
MSGRLIRYIAGRLVQAAIVLLVMSLAVYALIGLMPGDPIDLMVASDPSLTSADATRLRALQGLNRPIVERWAGWLGRVAEGDLGYSRLYSVPVADILLPRLGNTLLLMGTSLCLALAIAVPLGVIAAAKAGSLLDRTLNMTAFAGASIPTFWLAILLIVLFAVELGWLPASGSSASASTWVDRLRHLVLPVVTLTLVTTATFFRYVRGSVRETLREPFIRTARASGAGPTRVLLHHALRPALLPLVTILAVHIGQTFSGALVVETVFAYLGMGKLIYDAIMGNDFNLALTALMLATAVVLMANLLADLVYARLDPRIDLG